MKNWMTSLLPAAALALLGSAAFAKLPPPTEETKAKAAEATAKTAWSGKVDAFKLCKAQDKAAAHFLKTSGKGAAPASACADPGPFVYVPATAAPAAAAASAAPSATAAVPAKKP